MCVLKKDNSMIHTEHVACTVFVLYLYLYSTYMFWSSVWTKTCNYLAIWPTCTVVMATVVVDCMCVQSTMVEGTYIMQIYNLKVI